MDTGEFNSKRYSIAFFNELDRFADIRIKKMIETIKPCKKLLDVGCWDGYIMNEILKSKKAKNVTGVDNSKKAIKMCRRRGFEAKLADATKKLPFRKSEFDAITAGEIIEHLYDVNAFLDEAYRVLKTGGQFVITTPNLASFSSRITLLLGKIPWMIENELGNSKSGHIRYFTFSELERILSFHKFEVVEKITDVLHLGKQFYTTSHFLTKHFFSLGRIIVINARKK